MKARPISNLTLIVRKNKALEEVIEIEIKNAVEMANAKTKLLSAIRAQRMDAEHELINHPDSIWDSANNSYEFKRDMEVGYDNGRD